MRIVHLTSTPAVGSILDLIGRFPILERFPEAHHALGHQVALRCGSDRATQAHRHGLDLRSTSGSNRWERCQRLVRSAVELAPDVVHLHGITTNSALLALLLRRHLPRAVIAIQDQAFHWPRSVTGRIVLRLGLAVCDIAFFAERTLAEPLVAASALRPQQVVELPGGSTDFVALPKHLARRRTGLTGEPLYLWVGRLVAVKDPLLAARALVRVLQRRKEARLALVYGDSPLRAQVLSALAPVANQVSDLGTVSHEALRDIYSAADVYLSTSLREGYSFALAEALACGVSPVVSAIPASLKAIGDTGVSFPVGSEDGLVAALEAKPTPRRIIRDHFQQRLSYRRVALDSVSAYEQASRSR